VKRTVEEAGGDRAAPAAATRSVLDALRAMLLEGELRPGSPLRQESLAQQLGVSRVPIREALRMLEAEGVVQHTQNSGYSVVKLTADEVAQAYLIRRVLETELLRAITDPTPDELAELRSLNDQMRQALAEDNIVLGLRLNKDFHFAMFGRARMGIVEDYLRRAWALSDPYRSLVIYDPETPVRIAAEHSRMVDLLEAGQTDELVALMDRHRDVGAKRVLRMLQHLRRFGSDVAT
jgi:DNA-binding GntR family transcriptional regulator